MVDKGAHTEELWFDRDGAALVFSCLWAQTDDGHGRCVLATLWQADEEHCETGPALWADWAALRGPHSTHSLFDPAPTSQYYLHGLQVTEDDFRQYRQVRDSGLPHEMAMAWAGL